MKILLSSMIVLIFSGVLFTSNEKSDEFDYDSAWENVKVLFEQEGKIQTALAKVEEIYQMALKDKNIEEQYAAIQYKVNNLIRDNKETYDFINVELGKSMGVLKSLLFALKADFLESHISRTRFGGNTDLVSDDSEDIESMSRSALVKNMISNYAQSLSNEELKKIALSTYKRSIISGDSLYLTENANLYEVISLRYVQHLYSDSGIDGIADFPFSPSELLSPLPNFLKLNFEEHKENYLAIAGQTYQTILRDVKNDKLKLIFDKSRLNYYADKYGRSQYIDLNLTALDHHIQNTNDKDVIILASLEKVNFLLEDKKNYALINTILSDLKKKFPEGKYTDNIHSYIKVIEAPELAIKMGEVYSPKQKAYFNLKYYNLPKVNVSLLRVIDNIENKIKLLANTSNNQTFSIKTEVVKKWSIDLNKLPFEYHYQTTDLGVLPIGLYQILLDSTDGSNMKTAYFQVTDITAIKIDQINTLYSYDRNSGNPLEAVKVDFYSSQYNRQSRSYDLIKKNSSISTKNGEIKYNKNNEYFNIALSKGNDEYIIASNLYFGFENPPMNIEGNHRNLIYTDRSIYRPGQTVYYKVIAFSGSDNDYKVLASKGLSIIFRDVNGQEITTNATAKTNEYGSYSGSFVIPKGRLNGHFSISVENDYHTIQVDEYKRPSFETKEISSKIANSRASQSTITVGAQGLAGNVLNDIAFTYSVERSLARPRFYWWPIQENWYTIKKGQGRTDREGNAVVDFSDDSKIYNSDPYTMLSYKITFKFTDQSGESSDFVKYVSFSDQEFFLNIESKETIQQSDADKSIKIKAYTANNDSVNVKGKLLIYQYYPVDPYAFIQDNGNSDSYTSFNLKDHKLIKTIDFESGKYVNLKLEAGNYLLSAQAKTKSGKEVRIEKLVSIIDFDKGKFATDKLIYHRLSNLSADPGQKVVLDLGSAYNMKGRLLVVKGNEILFNELTDINPTTCMTYNVKESDRGGISFFYFGIFDNRFIQQNINLDVPWSNKVLDIKYESVRNLLLPGEKEKHTISVAFKDKNTDVEVLSALYDASLDLLYLHNWNYGLYYNRYNYLNINLFGFNEALILDNFAYNTTPNRLNIGEEIPNILYHSRNMYGGYKTMSRNAGPELQESAVMMEAAVDAAEESQSKTVGVAQVPEQKENQIRENLKETVFFYPKLMTDATGKVSYEFTMNEALTRWRLMTLAHSKDMKLGYKEMFITTQKDLMIKANSPRILRFNDKVYLTANVSNLTDKKVEASVNLELMNHISDQKVDWSKDKTYTITLEPKSTKGVSWLIEVPDQTDIELLGYLVSASTANHKDAEKNVIPVTPDKIWITHGIPFHLGGLESGEYTIPEFGKNTSDKNFTLEINTNPAWIAFSSLPALDISNPKYAPQYMNRLHQYSVAKAILVMNPDFKKLLETIPEQQSKLAQNQELKDMLLEATPFVRLSTNEELNYSSMKTYLDNNMVNKMIEDDIEAIKNQQQYDGGFSSYVGAPSNLYTTTSLLLDIIALEDGKVLNKSTFDELKQRAIEFILLKMDESYNNLKNKNLLGKDGGGSHVDELFILANVAKLNEVKGTPSVKYYLDGVHKYWLQSSIPQKVRISHISKIVGNQKIADLIKSYFDENKITSKELGIYWEEGAWKSWRRLSISEHAALINYYQDNGASTNQIDQMKIWLLKHKQVQGWPSYQSTSDAIFALLNTGSKKQVSMNKNIPEVLIGQKSSPFILSPNAAGMIKSSTTQDLENKKISITNKAEHVIYGGIFSGFFQKTENIEKSKNNPLSITKEFYKEIKSKSGNRLEKITSSSIINLGEVIVSRIILKIDRDMDYLTLTDTRPSGFEPVKESNSFWWYKGYTTDITDYQANYFFYNLQKGTQTIENRIIAVHKGSFSGGIARFQSYYSPEFVSYTEGSRVEVQ
jgi:hypothetical protein